MRWFQELYELTKDPGIWNSESSECWTENATHAQNQLLGSTPFIFRGLGEFPDGPPGEDLALPFERCWFECFEENACLLSYVDPDYGTPAYVFGAGVEEISPGEYAVIAFSRGQNEKGQAYKEVDRWRTDVVKTPEQREKIMRLVRPFVRAINSGSLATEKSSRTFCRRNSTGEKEFHRIKRVIHVLPKKDPTAKASNGQILDWSHRWEVRGHWRKVEGIGKNRQGEYVVAGNTWVIPCTKGPEDKPLVKKTYLVDAEKLQVSPPR